MAAGEVLKCAACGGSVLDQVSWEPTVTCRFCGTQVAVPEPLRAKHPASRAAESIATVIDAVGRARGESQPAPRAKDQGSPVLGCLAAFIIGGIILGIGVTVSLRQERAEQQQRDVPAPLFERRLGAVLPREVRYAGLILQVREGAITNRRPGSERDRLQTSATEAYATLRGTARNPETKSVANIVNAIRLQLGDGRATTPQTDLAFSVEPQSTRDVALVFTVPFDATWEGAKLVLGSEGREPAELPLAGAAPAVAQPVAVDARGEGRVVNGDMEDATYHLVSGTLDRDSLGKRAEQGKRFLTLRVRVVNNSTFGGGYGVASDEFRLLAGGTPLAPVEYPIELIPATSEKEMEVVFVVPAGLTQAELQVGALSRQTARIPLTLPAER
jgi:hypothetical protein